MKLSPLSVAPYTVGYVADLIRHITGWSQRSEILEKPHVQYLDNYLRQLGAKTIIVENEYIDRHYIEDYAEYYSRCFQGHPKTCSRLHFFANDFNEQALLAAIDSNNDLFLNTISSKEKYLGFVVIRPIPKTCIARMCLKPYDFDKSSVKIIKHNISASLFGIDLKIESASFLEQDKVLSACATSAIWSLLNAAQGLSKDYLPSPSAITKSAFGSGEQDSRIFPANNGLRPAQVARSLRAYGLEPTIINKLHYPDKDFMSVVREIVFAYTSADIPVLVGGKVKDLLSKETLGMHLVCAMGYRCSTETPHTPNGIEKIYVHDDRYGPYVSLEASSKRALKFKLRAHGSRKNLINEDIEPIILIIGLYHKIRIDYDYVSSLCFTLRDYVEWCKRHFLSIKQNKRTSSSDSNKASTVFEKFLSSEPSIRLVKASSLKEEIIRRKDKFFSFNCADGKNNFATTNFPKYIWHCKFYFEGKEFIDILVDATDIPQGNLILGCIAYQEDADYFWKIFSELTTQARWFSSISVNSEQIKEYIGAFVRFFASSENDKLSSYYGHLKLPNRPLKDGESDEYGNHRARQNLYKIVRGQSGIDVIKSLDPNKKYIWAIDALGDLVIGEDIAGTDGFQGHPTLTNGQAARLGGELNYISGTWNIDLKSRAYSAHLQGLPQRFVYLRKVLEFNLSGCGVIENPEESKH